MPRLLDVWLLDLKEVYTDVPFTVVADWLQQGRLLGDDRVRIAGNQKWHAIATVPALTPYVPKPEPLAVEDRAEALEPVELGLDWRRPVDEEDEDVDMIPLIDISLVLLIFFMMTASVSSGIFSPIATPAARHQLEAIATDMYWVGVDVKSRAGAVEKDERGRPLPWYSFGMEKKEIVAPTRDVNEVTAAFAKELDGKQGEVKIRLRAERTLPIDTVKDATLDLQELESRLNRERKTGRVNFTILGEVSEPKGS